MYSKQLQTPASVKGHLYNLILVQHQTQCFKTNKQTIISALPFEDLKTRILLHNLLPLGNLHLLPPWTSPIVKTAADNFPPLCLSFCHILTCQSINYPLPGSSSLASFFTTYILLLCLEKEPIVFLLTSSEIFPLFSPFVLLII